MMQELIQWLNAQNIDYTTIDNEVVEIPNFGKMFLADLSGVESIFKSKDGDILMVPSHIEQEINAFDAMRSGAGISSDHFDLSSLIEFSDTYQPDESFREWVRSASDLIISELEHIN